MKRVLLDVPDMTTAIITCIYNDEKTYALMAAQDMITNSDNPDVMQGEKSYIVRASDRRSNNETPH